VEYLRLQGVLIQLWVFGLGLVIGSFLNVCICSDNIPVLSYLFLRGKCRHCQHKISALYPITEIITGIVFLSLFHSVLVVKGDLICAYIFYLIFCCLLIVGSIVDLKLYIIPNEITYTGLILAPIASLLCAGSRNLNSAQGYFDNSANQWMTSLQASMLGIFVGGGMIFLCGVIGKLVLRKDAMGFGDVKLMGVIGGFIGWKLAVATFFLAPFFGLLFGIPRLISKRGKMIPYGPFLSLAAFICLLFQDATVGIIDNYLDVNVLWL
jgi:leader peptidase (prepilin peptidase)/N-methyltransferase